MEETEVQSLGGVREDDGDPSLFSRHLLGLAVLVATIVPAYLATRPEGVPTMTAEAEAVAMLESEESTDEPAPEFTMAEIHAHIREVAVRYGISPLLVAAIIEAESEFNPRAVSRKGARGLMQLMPETASSLDVQDSFDPYENVEGGVRHLRRLMDRFNGNLPLVLAAYNAGEQNVVNYGGVPPYRETRRYVAKILRRINHRGVVVVASARPARRVVVPAAMNYKPEVRPVVATEIQGPREVLGPWAPKKALRRPLVNALGESP